MIERPVGVGGNVVESEALLESASGSGRDRRLARNVLQWSGAMLSFASFIALGAVAKRRWVGIEARERGGVGRHSWNGAREIVRHRGLSVASRSCA